MQKKKRIKAVSWMGKAGFIITLLIFMSLAFSSASSSVRFLIFHNYIVLLIIFVIIFLTLYLQIQVKKKDKWIIIGIIINTLGDYPISAPKKLK